ncbi:MAG: penicillin-binding protein [Clostridia bacterium]|nr:penicillin-binding protein [Clostridia bacterium]MBR7092175.1 penicillin-binding protein [Clostridia bacterium]
MFFIILVGVITACIVGCVMSVYVVTQFDDDIEDIDLSSVMQKQSSMILVDNGHGGWEELRLEGANSIWTGIDNIPLNMQNAMVAIEDERFWTHYGVDWKRTVAAVANLLLHFSSTEYGGSTITQQLIKIQTGENDHTIERKIKEIFRAVAFEREEYTKEQILEAYLNVLPLSGDIVGVGAAANQYFDVEAKDLTLAQCALIAGITQNPAKYNPWTHPENARYRQRVVLQKMYELGFISKDEYVQAYNEELILKESSKNIGVYDYYTDMVIDEVIADLMDRYGYSKLWASQLVYYGGLKIYSCENVSVQKRIESIFANDSNYPEHLETDDDDPQAAIYIMDYSGKCVAVVGGRGEKTKSRLLNRATATSRQPGSTIKPLGAYSLGIENNLINFSSPVQDCYIYLSDGTKWPHNYNAKLRDNGISTVDNALQRSLNTVPARLVQQLSPRRVFNFLTNSLHLTTLVASETIKGRTFTDIDLSPMALGGLTHGVHVREMAAAYQMFGNGGYYRPTYCYSKVTQGDDILLQPVSTGTRVLSEDSAYIMNRLLQHVVTGPNGTAKKIAADWTGWEVFAKTGTTQDDNDVYFAGGTTKYVGACWFGYDGNQTLNSDQTSYARILWNLCMKELHKGLTPEAFTQPAGVVELEYCKETGMLACDECPHKVLGVYKVGHIPELCTTHDPNYLPPTTATEPTTSAAGGGTSAPTSAATTVPAA